MDRDELKQCQLAIHELIEANDYENALPLIYAVLEEYPDDAATLHFLGYIWLMSGKEAFAYQLFRRALQEQPGNKALWTSLGRACHELDKPEEAIKYFMKSAELDPSYALAFSNLSATLVQLSEWDGAETASKTAIELSKSDLNAELNLAHCLLAKGAFKEGWKAWRKSLGSKFRKEFIYNDEPHWEGESGKTLVVYGEQGLGDEIFYATCLNKAIDISEKVIIDCDPRLETLFKRSFPKAEVHGTRRDDAPDWNTDAINARCPIGGLPEFFCNESKHFPNTPYLVADPERRIMWRSLFDSYGKKVIGISTHGGLKMTHARHRKLTADDLAPLLKRTDIQLVSLDYKPDTQIEGVKYFDWATQSDNYDDTAALIAELDMVVGVPTTALHCASALGVKTWTLVPKFHQWRYAQPSMPWYRSMRLIYKDDQEWIDVIRSVEGQI